MSDQTSISGDAVDLAGQGEPVAWAFEWMNRGGWVEGISRTNPGSLGTRNVEPLFRRSASASRPAEDLAKLSEEDFLHQLYREITHVYEGFAHIEEIASFAREHAASILRKRNLSSAAGEHDLADAVEAALDAEMRYDYNLPWSQFASRIGAEPKRKRMRAILNAAARSMIPSPAPRPAGDIAKLAEIPAAGSDERDFWLMAAEQHGFTPPGEHLALWMAPDDAVLKLLSEARKQGQRDVLGASVDDAAMDRALDAFFGHLPHPDKPWGGSWRQQMRDALAALATGGARHG